MQANLDQVIKPALASEVNALRSSGKDSDAAAMAQWVEKLTIEDIQADREFADALELESGNVTITLRHFGNGHTDNDTVVFLPGANVMHMGDLFFHKMHPYIDRPAGATTVGWRNSVHKAMELCDDKTVIVPGHGEITNKTGLATQITYFDQLQLIVETAIKDGMTQEAIGKLEPEQFKGLGFPQLRAQALTAMHEELTSSIRP
jgi:glyoxylase-like metal-dependent hydrolase (beta-lactamase superfamily II)